MKRYKTVSSTAWQTIKLTAISNYHDEVFISERKWNERSNCYVKTLEFNATETSVKKLYKLLKHLNGDCGGCSYCKRKER